MDWKRFQNGLSATIAHPAPLGEKNPTFPLAGEFPPFAVLLALPLFSPRGHARGVAPSARRGAVANPPHTCSAGPLRRSGQEGRREFPAQPACGPFATFWPGRPSRIPRTAGLRALCDVLARKTVANPPHSRPAGPLRRSGPEDRREAPTHLPCGGSRDTVRRAPPGRACPSARNRPSRRPAPCATACSSHGPLDTAAGHAARGSGPRPPRTAISFP